MSGPTWDQTELLRSVAPPNPAGASTISANSGLNSRFHDALSPPAALALRLHFLASNVAINVLRARRVTRFMRLVARALRRHVWQIDEAE